jgi:hypothetical protein
VKEGGKAGKGAKQIENLVKEFSVRKKPAGVKQISIVYPCD